MLNIEEVRHVTIDKRFNLIKNLKFNLYKNNGEGATTDFSLSTLEDVIYIGIFDKDKKALENLKEIDKSMSFKEDKIVFRLKERSRKYGFLSSFTRAEIEVENQDQINFIKYLIFDIKKTELWQEQIYLVPDTIYYMTFQGTTLQGKEAELKNYMSRIILEDNFNFQKDRFELAEAIKDSKDLQTAFLIYKKYNTKLPVLYIINVFGEKVILYRKGRWQISG